MKKVILEPEKKNVVHIDRIGSHKTYIVVFGTEKYKLHRIGNYPDKYVFVYLLDSTCWANGIFDSMEDAIRAAIRDDGDVYEVDNMTDFIECLRK